MAKDTDGSRGRLPSQFSERALCAEGGASWQAVRVRACWGDGFFYPIATRCAVMRSGNAFFADRHHGGEFLFAKGALFAGALDFHEVA